MSDVDVPTLIMITIIPLNSATEWYNTVKDDKNLREAFHGAGQGVLLVKKALDATKTQPDGCSLSGEPASVRSLLLACNAKSKLVESIFKEVALAPKDSRYDRYQAAVRREGKGDAVEALVGGMMEDVCDMVKGSTIEAAMESHVKELREAIEKLSNMEPSMPSEPRQDSKYVHYGSGDQFNAPGGTQNKSSGNGNHFPGATITRNLNFGHIPAVEDSKNMLSK
ncbi:hypothetical protein MferCBS31731_007797 [Microsporum ferrugineum]